MREYILVVGYLYLKRPKYKWTIVNDVGGSFSNSGEYPSVKKCLQAIKANRPSLSPEIPVKRIDIEGFDESDKPVETRYPDSYLAALS